MVIFDPNWNPSHDLQAQDRSFRFGQKRHVVVFRLLAAGSLEELVYSRQLYKQQLSNIAVSGKLEKRYFEGVQVNYTHIRISREGLCCKSPRFSNYTQFIYIRYTYICWFLILGNFDLTTLVRF